MYTCRTLDGSLDNMLFPSFRLVNFSDEGAIVLVSTHLRYAWTVVPGDDVNASAVGAFIATSHNRSAEERRTVPQNPNKEDIHTPWRNEIYHQWNHVFYDVADFLVSVGPGIGHLHPPAHDAFALVYPVADWKGRESGHIWDYNILLLPAHLEPGVSIRVSTVMGNGEEKTLGKFDETTTADIWFIKEGTRVRFSVEGEYENVRGGVAAVLVCGRLDQNYRGYDMEQEQAGDYKEIPNEEFEGEEEDDENNEDTENEDEDEENNDDEEGGSNGEWEDDTTDEAATSQTLHHSTETPADTSF